MRLRYWLLRHPLTPLVASSALGVVLLAARVVHSRSPAFLFLCWNLGLAWIPAVLSGWIATLARRGLRWCWLLALLVLWLLFFPNAPYLVTDYIHLRPRRAVPLWYDVGLTTTFAFTGLMLALRSLSTMHRLVHRRLGRRWGWGAVGLASLLAGVGIYIGRFLRWNSWDVLFRPTAVLADAAFRFAHPLRYPASWAVSLLFGTLLGVLYLGWRRRPGRMRAWGEAS